VLFGALYVYHVLFSSPYFMPLHLSSAQFTQLLVIEQPARYSLRVPKCLLHNSCKSYEQAEIMKTTDNVYRIDLAGLSIKTLATCKVGLGLIPSLTIICHWKF
jgi:hypothetical protein